MDSRERLFESGLELCGPTLSCRCKRVLMAPQRDPVTLDLTGEYTMNGSMRRTLAYTENNGLGWYSFICGGCGRRKRFSADAVCDAMERDDDARAIASAFFLSAGLRSGFFEGQSRLSEFFRLPKDARNRLIRMTVRAQQAIMKARADAIARGDDPDAAAIAAEDELVKSGR